MKDGTAGRSGDYALSEVVGFVLLLGVLVAAMALWMMYVVPVEGRENEITQMNDVRDRFTDYKISLDSLWINSNNPSATSGTNPSPWTLSGVTLSTSFDLGTGGGNTQAGGLFLPMLKPIGSPALLSLMGDDTDLLMVNSSGGTVDMNRSYSIRKIMYQSQNNYWIQQKYYYQTGGVFLAQDNGATARVAPPISFVNSSAGVATASDFSSTVVIAPISLDGGAVVGGSGPVRVDSRLKTLQPAIGPDKKYWVNVSVRVADYPTAQMWNSTFISAMSNGGMSSTWYKTGTSQPADAQASAFALIMGPNPMSDVTHQDVILTLHPAEFAVTFNNVASGIT